MADGPLFELEMWEGDWEVRWKAEEGKGSE